jgi:hypothetical protein
LQQIATNPYNYDAWFDYIRLLQNESSDRDEIEDCYERAIANVPPEPARPPSLLSRFPVVGETPLATVYLPVD